MLHIINAPNVIDPATERHYAFYDRLDESQYPQVHDFYEITFVLEGALKFSLNSETFLLPRGGLVMVRPGDRHAKSHTEHSRHINLAFPQHVIDSLFGYLYLPEQQDRFLRCAPHLPVCTLAGAEAALLQEKLVRLNFIPQSEPQRIRSTLRKLLADLMFDHIMPALEQSKKIVQQRKVRQCA